ncbi:MAG TPA: helix-turn-helix domain-containing protein, partial [Xanthobacteraceae bacterium]
MKLKKITTTARRLRKRWYDDACGSALGLELVGERWSLLIVRELMYGGRRFSDLRSSLPGISANILTQRLEGLERVGIVQRRKLPLPASVHIYELTPWGCEAEIVLQELGRWAVRSPLHDPKLPLSAASIMMSFRTMYARKRAKGEAATIGFRFGDEAFVVALGPDGVRVRRDEPEGCALVIRTSPKSLASVVYAGRPLADAEAAG